MVAVIMLASVPASTARSPNCASSDLRLGASPPIPPIWIAIEEKFAKPHRANVAMVIDLGLKTPSLTKSAICR